MTVNDITLKSNIHKPRDLRRCKAFLIFTHGLGYCERQYQIDWEYFTNKDYLILTYNLRGHAGSEGVWTLDDSVKDLLGVVDFLINRYDGLNTKNIGLIGHSTGSLISLLAAMRDERIKFASAVTTVTCLKDSFVYWFKSGFNQEVKGFFKSKNYLPPIINQFMDDNNMLEKFIAGTILEGDLNIPHRYGMLRSESWGNFFREIAFSPDIISSAEKIKIPVIFFRGLCDEVMDPAKTDELYNRIKMEKCSKNAKLVITKSTNHFQNGSWDLIERETLNFFEKAISYV